MTVSPVAVGDGSPKVATAQPVGVNTRAHARETPRSVTKKDRARESRVSPARRVARVMWRDTTDSWFVREHSPAPRTVWNLDYTAHIPNAYEPFVRWCRLWRYPAVAFGLIFGGLKLLFIHPVRGPLTVGTAFVLYLLAAH